MARADIALFVAGLVGATGSSLAAYRIVGPYGDGPMDMGLYRAEDSDTGRSQIYREVSKPDGTVLRYVFDEHSRQLSEILVMRVVNGKRETAGIHMGKDGLTRLDVGGQTLARDSKTGIAKVGFSLRGNGVIDAWEFRDPRGLLLKIEVSRRQDGKVDRWEYYKDDQLERVEQDEDNNGRVDHWLNYEAGILVKESRDIDGDGRPDPG